MNWALQYPNMGKGGGATTVFWTKEGTVTLARLFRIKGEYFLQIAAGESIEQPRERLAEVREKWPQAYIKLYTQDIEKLGYALDTPRLSRSLLKSNKLSLFVRIILLVHPNPLHINTFKNFGGVKCIPQ